MTAWAWQPVPLSSRHRYAVYRTPVTYFAERVRRQRWFSYTQLNRRFWESLARPSTPLREETLSLLGELPTADPDLFVATSHLDYPGSDRLEAGAARDGELLTRIESTLPRGYVAHDGQLWKRATISGEIRAFYEALRPLQVIALGPDWLIELGGRLRLPRFSLKAIDVRKDASRRHELLDDLREAHARLHGEPTALLLQAGALAPWLVLKLHRQLRNTFVVDMGRALDVCVPERVFAENWGRVHRRALSTSLGPLGLDTGSPPDARRLFGTGALEAPVRETRAPRPAPPPAGVRAPRPTPRADRRGPVRFVENKDVDFDFVRAALQESARANHWTNFGPTTARLEEAIAGYLGLPASRRVVMTSSGTAALFALAGLAGYRAGRELRWAISAFGFHPSRQGPFTGATIVDCDARGLLDVDRLAALDPEAWDAALVTNTFGVLTDPAPWVRLCRERGKILALDSALALDAPYRGAGDVPDEIVSFHHTKPWGMGEGGCVIVDRDDEDAVRSVINFGIYRGHATGDASFNGKISDFSSGFILQRLRDFADVSPRYHLQYGRIAEIARRAGFEVLGGVTATLDRVATPSNVPLLAPHPVAAEHLDDPALVLRKYYRPIGPGAVAADLYARIVNVPCHPELERLSAAEIARVLEGVLARSAPR